MKRYTVHRLDHVTRKRVAVGCIVERRWTSRELRQNFLALQAEARELFGGGCDDTIDIIVEFPKPAAGQEERAAAGELPARAGGVDGRRREPGQPGDAKGG